MARKRVSVGDFYIDAKGSLIWEVMEFEGIDFMRLREFEKRSGEFVLSTIGEPGGILSRVESFFSRKQARQLSRDDVEKLIPNLTNLQQQSDRKYEHFLHKDRETVRAICLHSTTNSEILWLVKERGLIPDVLRMASKRDILAEIRRRRMKIDSVVKPTEKRPQRQKK